MSIHLNNNLSCLSCLRAIPVDSITGDYCTWCGNYLHKNIEYRKNKEDCWVIRLNKYQRDNLLWLLTLVWEGHLEGCNTGDWVGEIPYLLSKEGKESKLDDEDLPDVSIEKWIKDKG